MADQNKIPPGEGPAPDGCYVLLDDMAMSSAVDMATRTHVADGNAPLSSEQIQEARSKAQTLLKGMTVDGMQDMRMLTLSLGMPSAKLALKHLVDFGAAPDPVKQSFKASIDRLYDELPEHGCQEISFFNKKKKTMDIAYLLLDECPIDHNLTKQLDKLAPHITPEKRPEIMKHLTALVFIGRSVFAKLVNENRGLVVDILRYLPASEKVDIDSLHVDPSNTTLCVHPRTPKRIGIWVRFKDDVDRELAQKKAADESAQKKAADESTQKQAVAGQKV